MSPGKPLPEPRYAALRTLYDPEKSEQTRILDTKSIVLYFQSPRTVTGEDVLELHIHGGPATVKAVLAAIPRCPSSTSRIRYAEPGEFTKRAFLNDRLDLAQVESLSDTLDAETEQQRRAAVRGNSGVLGSTYEAWRAQLLETRGEIEALIDFSEDQHFDETPSELLGNVVGGVRKILESIDVLDAVGQRNELLRNGIRIALLGPPNVGKSSLMNLVVGREASIVSHEAGTTRDIVEAHLDVRGYLCTFADTAGFRSQLSESQIPSIAPQTQIGAVEEEGIRRAKQKALDSDTIIVLASIEQDHRDGFYIWYDEETLQLAENARQHLIVINKCDVVGAAELKGLIEDFRSSALASLPAVSKAKPVLISCWEAEAHSLGLKDAGGIQGLVERLVESFAEMTSLPSGQESLLGVTERQRQLLAECRRHLEDFMNEARPMKSGREPDVVLAAEHLRHAGNCLARITGRGDAGDVEEVLGVIFEKYSRPSHKKSLRYITC